MCLCLDMGQGTVYQVLGFIVVISENYIPIVTLFAVCGSSILFVSVLFFTVNLALLKCLFGEAP